MRDLFVYALRHWIEIFEALAALTVGAAIGIALSKRLYRGSPRRNKVQ